ncbi:hypothetical protein R1sor_022000 [Riccia sorocarpa]|uniref:glutathione transferase n=1 Tax=Riccia sorocarpa TaxID=122646 RepID=A0ABD3GMV7_9MARC
MNCNITDLSLKTPSEFKNVGAQIFQLFAEYLKSKKVEDSSKQQLLDELKALDQHLREHVSPLLLVHLSGHHLQLSRSLVI